LAGIDITTLSIFSGAVGVGLGFGPAEDREQLRERIHRAARPVAAHRRRDHRRGAARGVVQAIESRYTVLKGGDGTETIIPNETLITKDVIHHTYSDPKVSAVVAMTVSYDTDAGRACEVLAAVGQRHPRVLKDPPPVARVVGLGDHGIQMELQVWIGDPASAKRTCAASCSRTSLRTSPPSESRSRIRAAIFA
jgi:small-conductance mechanosensitive channel